jgi:hypothetical protein
LDMREQNRVSPQYSWSATEEKKTTNVFCSLKKHLQELEGIIASVLPRQHIETKTFQYIVYKLRQFFLHVPPVACFTIATSKIIRSLIQLRGSCTRVHPKTCMEELPDLKVLVPYGYVQKYRSAIHDKDRTIRCTLRHWKRARIPSEDKWPRQ